MFEKILILKDTNFKNYNFKLLCYIQKCLFFEYYQDYAILLFILKKTQVSGYTIKILPLPLPLPLQQNNKKRLCKNNANVAIFTQFFGILFPHVLNTYKNEIFTVVIRWDLCYIKRSLMKFRPLERNVIIIHPESNLSNYEA